MARPAAVIALTQGEETTLRRWLRARTTESRRVERARIIVLASQGRTTQQIAQACQRRPARVAKRRQRLARYRLAGLEDRWRPGRLPRYDAAAEKRVLAQPARPLPERYG